MAHQKPSWRVGTGKTTFKTALNKWGKAVQSFKSNDKLLVVTNAPRRGTTEMVFVVLRRENGTYRCCKVEKDTVLDALNYHLRSAWGCVNVHIGQWGAVGKSEAEAIEYIGFDWRVDG